MAARKTFTITKPLEERFWVNVNVQEDVTVCWEWTASTRDKGYGSFGIPNQTFKAHRLAFWLWYGWWPTICRHYVCDNPLCCNPYHLRDGTVKDNVQDMLEQNRGKYAAVATPTTLTEPLTDSGLQALAKFFSVKGSS